MSVSPAEIDDAGHTTRSRLHAFGSGEGSLRAAMRLLNRGRPRQYRGMDAANPSATPTFASRTPLHIGAVGLIARDLDLLAGYYQHLLGLTVLERTAKMAKLGVNGVTLLEIEHRPDARPDDQGTAGLYHTAFLMPTRQDHARWILHIARNRVPISGASDHGVSEAFYLDDPEGNGIEVYNDRPKEQWQIQDGMVVMQTKQLDIEAILREVEPGRSLHRRARRSSHRAYPSAGRQRRTGRAVLSRRRRPRPDAAARRRDVHVVRRLSPSRRRQCLAQRRRQRARQGSRGPRLVLHGGRRQRGA